MILSRLIANGLWRTHASAIVGDYSTGATAAGTTQATAYVLVSPFTQFSTVGAGSGCVLPGGTPNDSLAVYNGGANALTVYPPVGGSINGGTTNAGVSVAVKTLARFTAIDSTGLNYATG